MKALPHHEDPADEMTYQLQWQQGMQETHPLFLPKIEDGTKGE